MDKRESISARRAPLAEGPTREREALAKLIQRNLDLSRHPDTMGESEADECVGCRELAADILAAGYTRSPAPAAPQGTEPTPQPVAPGPGVMDYIAFTEPRRCVNCGMLDAEGAHGMNSECLTKPESWFQAARSSPSVAVSEEMTEAWAMADPCEEHRENFSYAIDAGRGERCRECLKIALTAALGRVSPRTEEGK